MKKVLLGTTALVMTAGAAAADVSLSGYAEIGVADNGADSAEFHHDLDVKFSLSGESDNGLSFGATIDLDEVGDDTACAGIGAAPSNTTCVEEHSVWVSGSFGTVTMGDTDGAFDWAMAEVGALTSLNDAHTTHAGFNFNSGLDGANDGQVLRYDNSFGDISLALSAELDDSGTAATGDVMGVGVKWAAGDFSVGVGYQEHDTDDVIGVSLGASFGDIAVGFNYSETDTNDHMGVGVTYSTGALSLHANYGQYDTPVGTNVDDDGFGIAANYDLGGGAVAMFGYGSSIGAGGDSLWSAGLGLSF